MKTKTKKPLTSYEKLKAENEKLVKENQRLINEKVDYVTKLSTLKNLKEQALQQLTKVTKERDQFEKELSALKPKEISFHVKNIELKEGEVRLSSSIPVSASSLKAKRNTVEKNKEEAIRGFDQELKSVDVEINNYILTLDNEKNILTK